MTGRSRWAARACAWLLLSALLPLANSLRPLHHRRVAASPLLRRAAGRQHSGGRARRAEPQCAIDLAECLRTFVESGVVTCATQATDEAARSPAVVDDVFAGLTGGFVGCTGTIIALELRKAPVKNMLKCEYCEGTGRLKCGTCFGAGCDECKDTGSVRCVTCAGTGRAVSTEVEKQQFRAIFGLFPEMRYGPESTMFDDRDPDTSDAVETTSSGRPPSQQ